MSGAEQRDDLIDRDVSIGTFVAQNEGYFSSVFERVQRAELPAWHMNIWAFVIPWFWAAQRGVWLVFWLALAIDMIALVCLMQNVKLTPLLATALADADNNAVLIERYSRWITNYTWVGVIILVAGRVWIGTRANRWYYSQYNRWRISDTVASGVVFKRVVLAVVIMAIVAPITLYCAGQIRTDTRACLNQIRAGETVEALLLTHGAGNIDDLLSAFSSQIEELEIRAGALAGLSELIDAQKAESAAIRKDLRDTSRNRDTAEQYRNVTAQDRFDCFFIDDFPTLVRFTPPPEVRYRRVPDEEAIAAGNPRAAKILIQEKPPVEGRRVNTFTYTAEEIDTGINYLRARYATFFDAMTNILRQSLIRVEVAFMQTPWPVVAFLFLVLSWAYTKSRDNRLRRVVSCVSGYVRALANCHADHGPCRGRDGNLCFCRVARRHLDGKKQVLPLVHRTGSGCYANHPVAQLSGASGGVLRDLTAARSSGHSGLRDPTYGEADGAWHPASA